MGSPLAIKGPAALDGSLRGRPWGLALLGSYCVTVRRPIGRVGTSRGGFDRRFGFASRRLSGGRLDRRARLLRAADQHSARRAQRLLQPAGTGEELLGL